MARIGNHDVNLALYEIGTYRTVFVPETGSTGKLMIYFSADDGFGDTALAEREVEIAGNSILHIITRNIIVIGTVIVLLVIAAALIALIILRGSKTSKLEKRLAELDALEKRAQEMYFHTSDISKDEYNQMMEKYGKETKEVQMKLYEERGKK